MQLKPFLIPVLACTLCSCNENLSSRTLKNTDEIKLYAQNPYSFITDIPLPEGYTRKAVDKNSFAYWLRKLPLKKSKTVYKFDGQPKLNQLAQFAVIDISTGTKDLQQCADAAMRLRAEYLYSQNEFEQISFTDNNNTIYKFNQPYTRNNFTKYLERVFGMCGSASLSKQLKPVKDFKTITSGDIIIRGGFPGHAVIVMDVAENKAGEKIYLLAQSFMPAQDIHVLINPVNDKLSPWYQVNGYNKIYTPEYSFTQNELMRW